MVHLQYMPTMLNTTPISSLSVKFQQQIKISEKKKKPKKHCTLMFADKFL